VSNLLNLFNVALVFDRYDADLSIKTGERQRRGANPESASTYQIMGNRPVPNYPQFLKGSGNKAALADFVTRYVLENARERLPTDCCIITAGRLKQGEVVKCISGLGDQMSKNCTARGSRH